MKYNSIKIYWTVLRSKRLNHINHPFPSTLEYMYGLATHIPSLSHSSFKINDYL